MDDILSDIPQRSGDIARDYETGEVQVQDVTKRKEETDLGRIRNGQNLRASSRRVSTGHAKREYAHDR